MNLGLLCQAKAEDVLVRFPEQNPSIVAADWGSGRRMFWKSGVWYAMCIVKSHQEQRRTSSAPFFSSV